MRRTWYVQSEMAGCGRVVRWLYSSLAIAALSHFVIRSLSRGARRCNILFAFIQVADNFGAGHSVCLLDMKRFGLSFLCYIGALLVLSSKRCCEVVGL